MYVIYLIYEDPVKKTNKIFQRLRTGGSEQGSVGIGGYWSVCAGHGH